MKAIVSPLKISHYLLMLVTFSAIAVPELLAAPNPQRTVIGRVDGQKFGTNVVGDGGSVNFEADSKEEERLFAACELGGRCKVVVTIGAGDVVTRLISAERMLDDVKLVAPLVSAAEPGASGPSFACDKAEAPLERAICASTELSALDYRMAQAYRTRLNSSRHAIDRQALQQQQREWVRKERSACGIEAICLTTVYRARIEALKAPRGERGIGVTH